MGYVGPDGNIYGIPCNAEGVLRIDPRTNEVAMVGGPWAGTDKWEGGVATPDGLMYCMPQRSKRVLIIKPGASGVNGTVKRPPVGSVGHIMWGLSSMASAWCCCGDGFVRVM